MPQRPESVREPYRVFICHAYAHKDIYFELVQKLNNAQYFDWRNLSVQYDMRFGSAGADVDNEELRTEISKKISECEVVLALTKPVASRRRWLQWEIKYAKSLNKPVIGIARRRNDSVSSFVEQHADDIVDTWRINHIVSAIKLYGGAFRSALTTQAKVKVPAALPDEVPDLEVAAEPTDLAPDEQAGLEETMPVLDEPAVTQFPRDILFRDFGKYIPGQRAAQFAAGRKPRWWWPFTKEA